MAGTVSSDLADGPVLSLINKRLRALRKKLNRITQMEDSVAQGKALNKEQEETLRSKPYVVAAIDELDKLRQPLSAAVAEEITAALEKPAPTDCEAPVEKEEEAPAEKEGESFKVVEDLLNLLYFGSMFDVKSQNDYTATMLTRTHERGCCLTYDYVTDDDNAVLLGERDLDLISSLGGLLVSRPANSSLSHKSALQSCIEHAKLWLSQSDQHIGQAPDVTYAQLREKLNKIMASDYFTAMPEMRFPAEVASATGSYASFQAPAQGSVLTADTVPDSGVAAQNEQREELVAHTEEAESYDYQSGHVEQFQQAEEAEQFSEVPSQEDENREDPREFELREQQQAPRRSYRGGSRGMGGGGRRGYPNGRGGRGSSRGGGYQNGRGQYYDQPGGSYYPRNNFRGRGGRGGSYGGANNYPAATEAGTAAES